MSDLKVYAPYDYSHEPDRCPSLVYDKSEVDKVIAGLEKNLSEIQSQKMQLEDDVALLRHDNAELKKACNDKDDWCLHTLKEFRHQKYKCCLAMAKWCFTKSNYHFILFRHGEDVKENYRKSILYSIWRERWLELAEEPTWEKFLQLIHKVAK